MSDKLKAQQIEAFRQSAINMLPLLVGFKDQNVVDMMVGKSPALIQESRVLVTGSLPTIGDELSAFLDGKSGYVDAVSNQFVTNEWVNYYPQVARIKGGDLSSFAWRPQSSRVYVAKVKSFPDNPQSAMPRLRVLNVNATVGKQADHDKAIEELTGLGLGLNDMQEVLKSLWVGVGGAWRDAAFKKLEDKKKFIDTIPVETLEIKLERSFRKQNGKVISVPGVQPGVILARTLGGDLGVSWFVDVPTGKSGSRVWVAERDISGVYALNRSLGRFPDNFFHIHSTYCKSN